MPPEKVFDSLHVCVRKPEPMTESIYDGGAADISDDVVDHIAGQISEDSEEEHESDIKESKCRCKRCRCRHDRSFQNHRDEHERISARDNPRERISEFTGSYCSGGDLRARDEIVELQRGRRDNACNDNENSKFGIPPHRK